ncbi:MAG TPA: M20/M25/M40 family metallo-hydrolase [Rhizomicrobium sp.]|jgi:acetylornithine deacetylase/succinyl-diaminopimelate desuccinylase-like protein|nr:M20/M25/M40 family metallo-hydrolase [Rhizomicrobium sp.]
MDTARLGKFVEQIWEDAALPALTEYMRIPNKSPAFDPEWEAHGYMRDAVRLMESWAREHLPKGAVLEIVQLPGRTPLMFIEVPGDSKDTILLYGHLDKQPEMAGWTEGTGPWMPVRKGDKLYGRGGADDGYAMFAALSALLALQDLARPHARCVIVIEACEESGSPDLPFYVDHLAARIGDPSLVVCLDSGCGDYERLWLTTSLRGMAAGSLTVRVLEEGVHSGDASGVVPSSFRILRELLSRLEDQDTGAILADALHVRVPAQRIEQAHEAARILGDSLYTKFPFAGHTAPVTAELAELVLNRTWRPQLAVIGMDGLPTPQNAGNVLLPYTTARLSLRLPPTLRGSQAGAVLKQVLEAAPPYGSEVSFTGGEAASGWNAPELAPWLEKAVTRASKTAFGPAPAYMGEGGSIPFMAMLGEKFPSTQFVVTGVLGPHSNAHGPNEFLHIPTARRVTMAVASIIADQFGS